MCDHQNPQKLFSKSRPRFGSSLEDGRAHTQDHARWSRRDFMTSMGLAVAGGVFTMGGTPVHVYGRSPLLDHLRRLETDRVLVIIQLSGGNDGLNTVVPISNDRYYQLRPTIAIRANQAVRLNGDLGMHPSLKTWLPHYEAGRLAVVQNVGYPNPDLSHFRSTDIWESASFATESVQTGWLGRYLDTAFPNFSSAPLAAPLAMQIGRGSSLLLRGPDGNMGISIANVTLFQRLAETGQLWDADDVPATTYGREMAFVRQVLNDSFQFAEAIQHAGTTSRNRVNYPFENDLAKHLAIVAQMIKGRLGARIYTVVLSGFDTHSVQAPAHATLLRQLAEAVDAFLRDLDADRMLDDVLVMTYSEFGRRIHENGSRGTDHGTAAPLFVLGGQIGGGLYGANPNLGDLDATGNLAYKTDFRSVYATMLRDWFEMAAEDVEVVLGGAFDPLGFLTTGPTVAVEDDAVPAAFTLHQNYPNPFNPATTIRYTLAHTARVRLEVYDLRGRLVRSLVDATQPAGTHTRAFDADGLASGVYVYRLETPDGLQSRQMTLLR